MFTRWTTDESLHFFVLPSENQNAFARSADFEFQFILYSRNETARHLVRSDFLQRYTQNFEIRRRVPRVKNQQTDENQHTHTHTHTHTPLYLSIRRCNVYFDVPAPVSLSLSLSLSLSPNICKHGLDPDQTRMVFRIECFVNLKMCACDRSTQSVNTVECPTLPYKSRFGFWVLIGS